VILQRCILQYQQCVEAPNIQYVCSTALLAALYEQVHSFLLEPALSAVFSIDQKPRGSRALNLLFCCVAYND
jgi:hypothetical protein